MVAGGPRTLEELLSALDISCAGGATPSVEDAVVPSVPRILEEEEVSEADLGFSDDEVSEDFQDSEDEVYWYAGLGFRFDEESDDSDYASTTEDEEDEEDPDSLVLVSPRSEASAPPASSLSSSTSTCVDSYEDPRPSTSGLNSAKRTREEDNTMVRVKRRRTTCVDSHEEPRPSTSGLSSTKRSREESNTGQVSAKRQRKTREDHPEERRSSTSSLSSSTVDQWWLDLSDSDED